MMLADSEEYWLVEKILGEEMGKLPGQRRRQKLYLVKWEGYVRLTKEPASMIQDTDAFKEYMVKKKKP